MLTSLLNLKIQEIKRVNKLWSDAEFGLLEHVYIPVNSSQLSVLRRVCPTIDVIQNRTPSAVDPNRKSSTESLSEDSNVNYRDYLSRIDQQIRTAKQTLDSLDNSNLPFK
jgi:hypothetical protein